ncbi:MAG: hypothetical protein ACKV2Q_05220 [Planctomycetaceae bacterium]
MRTRRVNRRATSRYAHVIELLESRCLLSGAGDLIGDTQDSIALPPGILAADEPPLVGTIDDATDRDLFAFTAESTALVEVREIAALDANGESPFDGVLQVFDAGSLDPLASDFGSANTTIPRVVTFAVEEGETYFAEVSGFGGSVGDFELSLTIVTILEDAVGNSQRTALDLGQLEVGASLERSSTIDFAGDRDVFAFRAATSGTVLVLEDAIVVAESIPLNGTVQVFREGSDTPFVTSSFSLVTTARTFGFDAIAGELYFVQISGGFGSTGDYQLTLSYVENDVGGSQPAALDLGTLEAGVSLERSSSIDFLSDADFFAFRAVTNGRVLVQEEAIVVSESTPFSGALGVFREGSAVAFVSDFFGSGTTARSVSFDVTAGELYFVQVTGSFSIQGEYQLILSLTADVGDTLDAATDLPLVAGQATFESRINARDEGFDRDFFRIQAPAGNDSAISVQVDRRLETSATGDLDSFVQITNDRGDVIAFNDDRIPDTDRQSLVQFNATAGETYFVEVRPFDGRVDRIGLMIGDYSLFVSATPERVPDTVANIFREAQVVSLTSGFVLERVSIDYPADQDVFVFEAPSNGIVRVGHQSQRNTPLDAQLAVFDDEQRLLRRSPVPLAPHFSSDLEFSVTKGERYFVRASLFPTDRSERFGEPTGTYALTLQMVTVSDAPAPAPPVLSLDNPLTFSGTIDVLGDTDTIEFQVDRDITRIDIDFRSLPPQTLTGALSIFVKRGNDLEIVDFGSASFGQRVFSIPNALAGDTFVIIVDSISGTGGYQLLIEEIGEDDFPNFIPDFFDDFELPLIQVQPSAVITGRIGDELDIDVFRIVAPAGSQIVATTPSNVFLVGEVRFPDGTFGLPFLAGDLVTVTGEEEIFLSVSRGFDLPFNVRYEITVQTVMTDGRFDSPETAARVDDLPEVGITEQITSTGDSFAITGELQTVQDSDFFRFTAPFTGALTITAPQLMAGVNADSLFGVSVFERNSFVNPFGDGFDDGFDDEFFGEPLLESLFLIGSDPNGQRVRSANGLPIFVFQGLEYFVLVNNLGTITGAYQLDLQPFVDDFPSDFDNAALVTLSEANAGSVEDARLEFDLDADFFRFVANNTGTIEIELSPAIDASGQPSPLQAFLDVFSDVDPATDVFNFLGREFSFDGLATAMLSVIAGETYYFAVFNESRTAAAYQIDIRPFEVTDDVPPDGRTLPGFSSAAPRVLSGSIEVSGDIDTYRFTADADRTLQISLEAATRSSLDPIVAVRVISEDDSTQTFVNDEAGFGFNFGFNFGFSLNSFLSVPVLAGQRVEIDARGFGSSRGAYRLTITGAAAGNGGNEVTPLVPPQTVTGSISQSFETDMFQFTPVAAGVATVELNAFEESFLDPRVTIQKRADATADASFVAADDDSGLGLNSRVTFPILANQIYDVLVAGFGFSIGAYSLTVSLDTANGDDFGDTFDRAAPVTFRDGNSFFQAGAITESDTDDDVDVFSFVAGFSGTLNLRVLAFADDLRAGLSVFQASPAGDRSDVELLAVSGATESGEQTSLFVPVNEGRTYFVRLVGLPTPSADFTAGSYLLGANATADLVPAAPSAARIHLDDAGAGTIDSLIDFESDRDWFRLIAPAPGTFTIDLERDLELMPDGRANQLDPVLTVYDDRELPIARNGDANDDTLNSRLTIQARTAGEVFFVEAAGFDLRTATGTSAIPTVGGYRVSANFVERIRDDFGDDPGHLQLISVAPSRSDYDLNGRLEMPHDRDFFVFTAAVDASATIGLNSLGAALPSGVELSLFKVEASSLANISIDSLTQLASIAERRGPSALESFSFDVLKDQSFVVAVSHVGATLNSPVDYTLSLNFDDKKVFADTTPANAALFSLVSLADGAARRGDRNSTAITDALQVALSELGKTGQFFVVLLDPVNDPVLTDSQGRQSGFTSSNGTLNETPGGYVSAGTFGQILIVPVSSAGTFELRFAGTGLNLDQSFSAFVVGPSGTQTVSQGTPRMTASDGKTNFVIELGFGGVPITKPASAQNGQGPSFFTIIDPNPTERQPPAASTTQTRRDEFDVVLLDDARPTAEADMSGAFDPLDPSAWLTVFESVLQELQFEGLSRPTIERVLQRLQENDSSLPAALLNSSTVVRSAKAMFDVGKYCSGWFRNAKPTTPTPKQRTPPPKATQEKPSPKNAPQVRHGSTKAAQLGG